MSPVLILIIGRLIRVGASGGRCADSFGGESVAKGLVKSVSYISVSE